MALDVKLWSVKFSIAQVKEPGKANKLCVVITSDQPFVARNLIAELDPATGAVTKYEPGIREPDVYLPLLACLGKVLDSVFEESGKNFVQHIEEDLFGKKLDKPEEPGEGGWSH